ncbi:MAG: alpha/beta hydrolase [Saprospiraceae bacterium]
MAEHIVPTESKAEINTLVFEVTTTDNGESPIYLSGDFNGWNAAEEMLRLKKISDHKHQLQITIAPGSPETLTYKYTRGSWDTVEIDEYGNEVKSRIVQTRQQLVQDHVPRWKQNGLFYNPALLPKKVIISENFEIPQLIKTRRIAALLPHDYENSDKKYPVLYLQDGQNLFDDFAPFGNWAVDKKLAVLAERGMGDVIIVAIDHAEEARIAEFTPSMKTRLGRGDGKKYVRFLADTLKPYVDKTFRTLPDRQHTGMGGSSMGGLITIYAGLMYPEVYGKLMVFSPSLWVVPNIHFNLMNLDEPYDLKIYLYGGGNEGAYMVPNMQRFVSAVEQKKSDTNIDVNLSIDPKGKHNEVRWGEEFPKAIEWLFFNQQSQKTQTI